MSVIKFDIRHANGHRESAVVEGERALIGSGAHCEVRLPMDQAAYEHVLLEVQGGTLRAAAKVEDPSPTINGVPFAASALSPDSVVGVGSVRLYIAFTPDSAEGASVTTKDKKDESSTPLRVLMLLLLGVAVYLLMAEPDQSLAPPPEEAPQLFTAAAAVCPQSSPQPAFGLAQERFEVAEGKRERMPFSAKDGVSAVGLYDLAAACFKVATNAERQKEAETLRDSLKAAIIADFRARRLRMQHMLAAEDFELVKRDVVVLQDMTAGLTGNYVEWLGQVRKQLAQRGIQ